jgi:asparagine synthase (glutamine-hydrolysing)
MCGICGQFNFKINAPVNSANIVQMTKSLEHRGPDDQGFYISGPIGLGFRRLSIIDIDGGHQPMSDQDNRVWVIFNGEIYNYQVLKKELENYGHVFRTKSDTEVIVHGYKQWGSDVLDHLNGMFGLAIWDDQRRRLMLARDRMGIKLIYYMIDSNGIFFGSEIRPILAVLDEKPEVDPVALNLFLRYRYTPSPLTLFCGIKKLAPGTRLIVEEGGHYRLERWWNFKPSPFDPMPSLKQAEERLLDLYTRALKRHLISDVPLGLLLSGGLDSGLLLALMNQNGESWKTFTVGYGSNFADDELADAAQTANILKAPNVSLMIDHKTFEEILPRIISTLEEPIASSSVVPMYHVCKRAREDVKVALMGQGPDELFGGYTRHLGVQYGKYWRGLPKWFRVAMSAMMSSLPRSETIRRGLYSLDVPQRIRRYQMVFSLMPGELVDDLFHDGILPLGAGDRIMECWEDLIPLMEHTDELGGLQFLEIRSTLPDELLMYGDKLSMAHGLEVRVPYLDYEVVEYVECLSASFKIRNGSRKWLHRQICKSFLPKEVIRRKKRGFAVNVVDGWFRNSLASKMDGILLEKSSLMYKYLRPHIVQKLLDDHKSGSSDNHKILFSLVVFEEWLRSFYSSGLH